MNSTGTDFDQEVAECDRLIAEINDIYRTRRLGRFALLIHMAKTERNRVARWFRLGRLALLYTLVRTEVYNKCDLFTFRQM